MTTWLAPGFKWNALFGEAIGRIALTTSEWRPVLHGYAMEALDSACLEFEVKRALDRPKEPANALCLKAIVAWIRSGTAGRKLNKDRACSTGVDGCESLRHWVLLALMPWRACAKV